MAIDFPNSPALNDYFESNGKAWAFNGTSWDIVQTPASLTIADASITGAKLAPGAASANLGEITLGTNTTGNYVSDLTQGTGVTVTHTPGEGSSPTIAIGQSVSTSASVQFAAVTSPLIGNVTGNADTATALATSRMIELTGDVAGSVSFNGSANASITATIQPNSVELGTDTTGNYMSGVSVQNGLTVSHTPGEGSSATIGVDNALLSNFLLDGASGNSYGLIGTSQYLDVKNTNGYNKEIELDIAAVKTQLTTDGYLTNSSSTASVSFAQLSTSGDLTVGGNLTVNGTTTTLNTETLAIEDNIVVLNSNVTSSPTTNAGIEVERGSSTNVSVRWNETNDKWEFTNDGSTYGNIASLGNIELGTDTTGNYLLNVVAGTGISISHTAGEGSSASVALNATIDDLSNVTASSPSDGQFLKYVSASTSWVAANIPTINALDDIGDVSATSPTTGDFLKWNGSAWVNDAVDLGTDTTGNYISDLTQGTGVTITHTPGEGSNATIAIGQSVATSASVTFAKLDTTGDLTVGGNLTVNGTTTTLNTETLSIEDNTIVLNSNVSASPSVNAGIEIERGTSSNVQIRWNETTDKWQFTNDGTNFTDFGASGALISKLPNYTTTATRTNLLPDPNMENASIGTYWQAIKITESRSTDFVFSGTYAMKGVIDVGTAGQYFQVLQTAGAMIDVVAGQTYTFSAYIYLPASNTADTNWRAELYFNNGVGYTGSNGGTTTTITRGNWTRLTTTATVPAGYYKALPRIAALSTLAVGQLAYVDAWLLETGSTLLPYFDGTYADTYTGYTLAEQAWDGTADASTSTATWGQDSSYVAPIEGALWFDSDTAKTFVYYDSQWIEVGGVGTGARMVSSSSAPASPLEGSMWFDTDTAQTFVYYDSQWIEIGASAMGATVSTTAPTSPIGGQIWFNSDTGGTYVYYGSTWIEVGAAPVNLLLQAIDAKGDLLVGTADNTVDNLAVGANGSVLMADSSTATGLSWSTQSLSNRNAVINGAMNVWQRGTSIAVPSSANTYTTDRFYVYRGATGSTVSRQVTGDTTNLPNIQYCARVQRDSGNTSTQSITMYQALETVNSIPFAGKSVTLSFYARKGANFSHASSAVSANVAYGTGTDQSVGGYTGFVNIIAQNATLTTTWQRFTYTGTVAATATEVGVYFSTTPSGTAGAADYFEITGVQLEAGSVATPFEFEDYGTTLAKCQRYYWRASVNGSLSVQPMGLGFYLTATNVQFGMNYPVTMRANPTLEATNFSNQFYFERNGAIDYFNTATLNFTNQYMCFLQNTTEVSGTAGQAGQVYIATASSSQYVAFTAEL